MTDIEDQWRAVIASSYDQFIANMLKPQPLLEQALEESRERHRQWYASLTRWQKIKHNARRLYNRAYDKWLDFRRWLVDRIDPDGRACE